MANDIAVIPLHARDGSVRDYAIVSSADAPAVLKHRWSLDRDGYAVRATWLNERRIKVSLHREILGLVHGDGLIGDHINRLLLDCRRDNLRILTPAQSAQNVGSCRGATSKYRGVTWRSDRNKWRASVRVGGKDVRLGCFDDERDAAEAARIGRQRLLPFATD